MSELMIEFESTLASVATTRLSLPWLQAQLSARELIVQTVTEQYRLAQFQTQTTTSLRQHYLSQADIDRLQADGRIALPTAAPQPNALADEIALAHTAFEQRGFLLLVGDQRIESLDTQIQLSPSLAIRFVRLIPLRGG